MPSEGVRVQGAVFNLVAVCVVFWMNRVGGAARAAADAPTKPPPPQVKAEHPPSNSMNDEEVGFLSYGK